LSTHAHPDHFHIEKLPVATQAFLPVGWRSLRWILFGPRDVTDTLERSRRTLDLAHEAHPVSAFQNLVTLRLHLQHLQANHAIGEYEPSFTALAMNSIVSFT